MARRWSAGEARTRSKVLRQASPGSSRTPSPSRASRIWRSISTRSRWRHRSSRRFTTIVKDGLSTTGELLLGTGGTATTDVTELTTLSVDVVGDFNDVYRLTFTTSGAVKTDITVEGALAFDRLITGDGDDTLTGFDGNDVLKGNAGVDRLDGGADDDRLTGGANEDFFIFKGAFGQDVVLDFGTGVDKFDMDATLSFAALTITDSRSATPTVLPTTCGSPRAPTASTSSTPTSRRSTRETSSSS